MPTVLALETSCDESAAAIVTDRRVLSSAVASQIEEHARWGGVVPEIASRRHVEALPGLVARVVAESGVDLASVDAIAASVAPGLVGALLVGSVTGRTLARLHGKPFLGIHHLEGHLASVRLGEDPPEGPSLVLLVSGGHTELVRIDVIGGWAAATMTRPVSASTRWLACSDSPIPVGPRSRPPPARVIPTASACRRGGCRGPAAVSTPTTSVSAASRPPCCGRWRP
jgi:N6-L-threonylcarbamoyladenine synthase